VINLSLKDLLSAGFALLTKEEQEIALKKLEQELKNKEQEVIKDGL
jgi:hypothetical protein